jgi:PPM family protein phosphatase
MINISTQAYISETGKRTNNEDNYGLINGCTYIVCDGVGGSEKGEIASDLLVRTFIEAFKENLHADAKNVLLLAENRITEYLSSHPEAEGTASTLTFSQVKEDGIYIAWCGDSRIYQFRDGQIVFQTSDHSWVNEALKSGIITAEEAVDHPKSNIITRAVQGSHKPAIADTMLLTDIRKNDLFLLCSDGVLESWSNDDLKALFSTENDPEKILEIVKRECSQQSKDNYTAIVYHIGGLDLIRKDASRPRDEVEAIPLAKSELNQSNQNIRKPSELARFLRKKLLGIPIVLYLLAIIPFLIFLIFSSAKEKSKLPKIENKVEEATSNIISTEPSDTIVGAEQNVEDGLEEEDAE